MQWARGPELGSDKGWEVPGGRADRGQAEANSFRTLQDLPGSRGKKDHLRKGICFTIIRRVRPCDRFQGGKRFCRIAGESFGRILPIREISGEKARFGDEHGGRLRHIIRGHTRQVSPSSTLCSTAWPVFDRVDRITKLWDKGNYTENLD